MRALRPSHARSNRRQNENAFESFTKNKNADVESGDGSARVWLGRVWRALRENSLPEEDRDHRDTGNENAGANKHAISAMPVRRSPGGGGSIWKALSLTVLR